MTTSALRSQDNISILFTKILLRTLTDYFYYLSESFILHHPRSSSHSMENLFLLFQLFNLISILIPIPENSKTVTTYIGLNWYYFYNLSFCFNQPKYSFIFILNMVNSFKRNSKFLLLWWICRSFFLDPFFFLKLIIFYYW